MFMYPDGLPFQKKTKRLFDQFCWKAPKGLAPALLADLEKIFFLKIAEQKG